MWQLIKVREGEESSLLQEGYEPFAVVPEIRTEFFSDSRTGQKYTEIKSTTYIYLRRKEESCQAKK